MGETKEAKAKKAAEAKAAAAKAAAEKAAAEKAAAEKAAAEKAAAEKKDEKKDDFGTEIFYVEDPEFYKALSKKVSHKQNLGDFLFKEAQRNPEKTSVRLLPEKGEANGSVGRGKIKFAKGDFVLRDPFGNRLKVASEVFRAVYKKVIG